MNEFEEYSFDATSDMENDISTDVIDIISIEDASGDDFAKSVDEIDLSEKIKSIVDQNVQPSALPRSNGEWTGEPGNSEFIMDDDYIPSGHGVNLDGLTMSEIKEKYGFDGVTYNNKEPDFSQFADEEIGAITLDDFSSERTGQDGTYAHATAKAAEQMGKTPEEIETHMKEHGLTWHECGDRKTVLPIPTEINAAFKHSGGISVERNVDAFGRYLNDTYGTLTLERNSPFSGEQEVELDIEAAQKQIRRDVKAHSKQTKD